VLEDLWLKLELTLPCADRLLWPLKGHCALVIVTCMNRFTQYVLYANLPYYQYLLQ